MKFTAKQLLKSLPYIAMKRLFFDLILTFSRQLDEHTSETPSLIYERGYQM